MRNRPRRRKHPLLVFSWAWRPLSSIYNSGPRPLSEPESRIAYQLMRVRPRASIWFHQHEQVVDESGGNTAVWVAFAAASLGGALAGTRQPRGTRRRRGSHHGAAHRAAGGGGAAVTDKAGKPPAIRSLADATSFVERSGVALAFASDDLVLPSLWQATYGERELIVFRVDERGKRVLSDELKHVWSLKNQLGAERRACVGKHVSRRVALIALAPLPAFYALTARAGTGDDFRTEELSPLERELAEALLATEPQTAPDLRALTGVGDSKATKRALESLQQRLIVTQAGEAEQEHGWDAAVFDLLARRYRAHLRQLPAVEEARADIAAVVLTTAGALSAADLAVVTPGSRKEAEATLDRLADEGRAARRVDEEITLWSRPGCEPGTDGGQGRTSRC